MRAHQPGVTHEGLDRAVLRLDEQRSTPTAYGPHLRAWIARYSRGDALESLRSGADGLDGLVAQVRRDAADERQRYGPDSFLFGCGQGWIGRYRDGLLLQSLCLALDRADLAAGVLDAIERGDPLVEALAQALGQPPHPLRVAPAFAQAFDGLLRALALPTHEASASVGDWLAHWLDEHMSGMGFVDSDEGLGYWCFEAVGVVLARGLDDTAWRDHPHYPADLADWSRAPRRTKP